MLNLMMTRSETRFTQIPMETWERADEYNELVSLQLKNVFTVLVRKSEVTRDPKMRSHSLIMATAPAENWNEYINDK